MKSVFVHMPEDVVERVAKLCEQDGMTGLALSFRDALIASKNPETPKYRKAAKAYESEGVLEFDDDAAVSYGDEDGAYVMCWRWVNDSEVG
jgi:hypothetical protein